MSGWKIPNPVASLAEEDDDAVLPEAFLEFLTDWEDAQGEGQEPLDYAGPQWPLPEREAEQNDE